MKKLTTLSTLVLLAVMTMGFGSCSTIKVPANSVAFESPYGKLTMTNPQNTDMTNVVISIGTNGTVTAKIGSLHTVNNPDVIDKTAAGEVAKINALGTQFRETLKAGAEAAGAGAGAAVK